MITLLGQPIRIRMAGTTEGLALSIHEHPSQRKCWRDTTHKRLEKQLGQFIVAAFECANRLKAFQQEQARVTRQRQQAKQQRQEQIRIQQEELARFEALELTAQNWQRARIIEAYVAALEKHTAEATFPKEREVLQDYLAWAKEKVAWLDPLVKRDDPFLGKRQSSNGEQDF